MFNVFSDFWTLHTLPEYVEDEWHAPEARAQHPPLVRFGFDELCICGPGDMLAGVIQLISYIIQNWHPAHQSVLLLGKKRLLSQNFLQNSNVSIKQSHPVSSPRLLTHSLWSTPAWTGHQRASVWFCSDSTERRTAGDSSPVKTGSYFQLQLHLPAESRSRGSLSRPRGNKW